MLRLLELKPSSQYEIRVFLNMGPSTCSKIFVKLRKANLVHIVDWSPRLHGGVPLAIWAPGPGEDAPLPPEHVMRERLEALRSPEEKEQLAALQGKPLPRVPDRIPPQHPVMVAMYGMQRWYSRSY